MEHLFGHELLRTLVAIVDAGGFGRACDRVCLSQSAISLQIKRLEEQVGQPLFAKSGRKMALTEAGQVLVDYARRILALNAEAANALQGKLIEGTVRLGAPQDIAEDHLPAVLQKFSVSYPRVRLQIKIDRNQTLLGEIATNALDIAVVLADKPPAQSTLLGRPRIHWLAKEGFRLRRGEPLPLAMLEPPCIFRTMALAALDRAELPYRIAYTTTSLAGLRAAVDAGLGVTARVCASTDRNLGIVPANLRLPSLKRICAYLWRSTSDVSAASARLAELLEQDLRSFPSRD